ncbi:hypothetical protein SAMN04487905_1264 [Actinopolyspora xinjiangensis]|uniref:Uncharacterized protein n=1 Tax=Actinopolyspora xinjiangensis TaxID=405564 RepID=A0A1H0X371_9ACTN|nr:hypothetical protein SAMN04487905_1264 [Actinopolyspora xinjiangensis]
MLCEHRLHRRHRVHDEHSVLGGARQQHTISGTNRAPLTQQTRNRRSPSFGNREFTVHTAPNDHRVPRAPRPNTVTGSPAQSPQHTTLTHPATRINSRDPIGHRARTGRRQRRHRKPRNPTTSRPSHRNKALNNTLRSGFRRHDLPPSAAHSLSRTLGFTTSATEPITRRASVPHALRSRPILLRSPINSADRLRGSLASARDSAAGLRCQQDRPETVVARSRVRGGRSCDPPASREMSCAEAVVRAELILPSGAAVLDIADFPTSA